MAFNDKLVVRAPLPRSEVFMSLFDLDDKVTAAAVAAAGTVIGTLIQLHVTWRREVSDRKRGVPATKKSRRGPVLAVGLLLIGAAVGVALYSWLLLTGRQRRRARVVRLDVAGSGPSVSPA